MKRRITLAALALGLCLALLPTAARADDASTTTSGKWGGLTWTCDTNTKMLTITGSGPMPDEPLPDAARQDVSEVYIESGITTIGAGVFQNMGLTSVTIPNTVTTIGDSAFAGNSSLKNVTIPSGVTSIGASAFKGTYDLESIIIPGTVTTIGDSAFESSYSLKSVTIQEGVSSIGHSAFEGASKLTVLTLPASVKTVGKWAFNGCSGLTSVTISGNNVQIGSEAFHSCSNLASVTFAGKVGSIGERAFFLNSKLASVTFQGDVGSIGEQAFSSCYGLTSLTITGKVDSIGTDAFGYCWALTGIDIRGDVDSIGENAFQGCKALTSVTFPKNVGTIGKNAFHSCDALERFTVEGSVGSIGETAFGFCKKLTDFTVKGDVTSIGTGAFEMCDSLTSLTFPGHVTTIEQEAFADNRTLERITFEKDVGDIGTRAFSNCGALSECIIRGTVGNIGQSAFSYCSNLRRLEIHSAKAGSVIKAEAFEGCDALTRVAIPDGITEVQGAAFESCDSLTALYLPASVTKVGRYLFNYSEDVIKDVYYGGKWEDMTGTISQNSDGLPVLHAGVSGLPDIDAGDLPTLQKLIDAGRKAGRTDIHLTQDINLGSDTLEIPEDSAVVLDLKGHNLTSTASPAIRIVGAGSLTVLDSTVKAEPVVDDGRTVTYPSGVIDATNVGADTAAILVQDDGHFTLESGMVKSAGGGILVQGREDAEDDTQNQEPGASIQGGYVEAQESAAVAQGLEARLLIYGGVLLSQDNAVLSNMSTSEIGAPYIRMDDGTLISKSTTSGYLPCGIYQPKKGSIHVDGGTIYAEGGVGIVLRGGSASVDVGRTTPPVAIHVSGSGSGPTKGRVGKDSGGIELEAGRRVVLDQKSGYDDAGDIKYTIARTIQGDNYQRLIPDGCYPADGFELKTNTHYPDIYYRFGPTDIYTITFDPNGGMGNPTALQTNTDQQIENWPIPKRDGYVFRGWYEAKNSLNPHRSVGETRQFEEDTTLYASWTPVGAHVIVFYYIDYTPVPEVALYSVKVTDTSGVLNDWPEDPTRDDGNTFSGWFTDGIGGTEYRPGQQSYSFTGDTNIYAHWIAEPPGGPYTITFDPNGGEGGNTEAQTDVYGRLSGLPGGPSRAGYVFMGWSQSRENAYLVSQGSTFRQNSTLYAWWMPEEGYAVSFDRNDGSGAAAETRHTNRSGRVDPWPEDPARDGWVFQDWFTARQDGVKLDSSHVFYADTVLYACWRGEGEDPAYTVTFDPNGGEGEAAARTTSAAGTISELPGAPTRSGYTFTGWYTAVSGGEQVTTSTVFRQDATVYARWSAVSGTPDPVRYQIYTPRRTTGGSLWVSHSSAEAGDRITLELSPRSNYDLDWVAVTNRRTGRELRLTARSGDDYTFTMPASDVEVEVSFVKYTGRYTASPAPAAPEPPANTKPVQWFYSGGRISHVTDGLVPLGSLLTRDMLISVLYNMDPASTGEPAFWATNHGIVPDIYRSLLWGVDQAISREQTAMILLCYAQHRGCNTARSADITGYADYGQIRPVARPAMAWAQAAGVLTASPDGTLAPRDTLNCGQANAMLAHYVSSVLGHR